MKKNNVRKNYIEKRVLRVICREAGYQLYRLIARLIGARRR